MLSNLISNSSGRAGCKVALLSSLTLGLAACGGGSDTSTGGGGTGGGTTPAANAGTYKGNAVYTANVAAVFPIGTDSIQFDVMGDGTVKYTDITGGLTKFGTVSGNNIKITGSQPVNPQVAASCSPDTVNFTLNAVIHDGKTITGNIVSSAVTCTFNGTTLSGTVHADINATKI